MPFPSRELRETAKHVNSVMAVELSPGMTVEDVKLALNGSVPVEFYGRAGGNVPTPEEIAQSPSTFSCNGRKNSRRRRISVRACFSRAPGGCHF